MAEKDPYGTTVYDGIHRQKSECKIIIYSHVSGQVNPSTDVQQCQTSKTIKGGGGSQFTLLPRVNYMNVIFPNDYVNIYFNTHDGRGWIRTFLGFVDRVSRQVNTSPTEGKTTTRYQVVCSDITKAFDKTQIYFNPQISAREDIIGEFAGTANLGGIVLRTKGITMHGSPADIMMSLVHLLIGFGSQFRLPKSYPLNAAYRDANRKKRAAYARSKLSTEWQKSLNKTSFKDLAQEIDDRASYYDAKDTESLAKHGGPPDPKSPDKNRVRAQKKVLDRFGLPADFYNRAEVRAAKNVEYSTAPGAVDHLLDLFDFRYVEWKSIDGYVTSASITWSEGSLWSIINSWSNDMVNELFCDLRPMQAESTKSGSTSGGGKQDFEVWKGGYGVERDEVNENIDAVRYAPCIVMREYPFSTIEGIDPPSTVKVLTKELGLLYFGAIFSQEPNKPGRKVITMPAINESLLEKSGGTELGFKHLDVAVINVQDIINENIGRGDSDHWNLIEVYSDVTSGTIAHSKFLTRDIQPITSAVNIANHGLRVFHRQTRFGRFGAHRSVKAGRVDSVPARKVLARWSLLLDHWYQHNLEYLSGTITTRALPEIRVGFRLDVEERRESYYVEGTNHSWQYPNAMTSTFTLSRGQRNDPYPVYVFPHRKGFQGMRGQGSRLGQYFEQMDPSAVERNTILWGSRRGPSTDKNYVDIPAGNKSKWATQDPVDSRKGFLAANSAQPSASADLAKAKRQEQLKKSRRVKLDPKTGKPTKGPGGLPGDSGGGPT